jgi:hypothetical protein
MLQFSLPDVMAQDCEGSLKSAIVETIKKRKRVRRGSGAMRPSARFLFSRTKNSHCRNNLPLSSCGLFLTLPTITLVRQLFPTVTLAQMSLLRSSLKYLCVRKSEQDNFSSGWGVYVRAGYVLPKGTVLGPYTGDLISFADATAQREEKSDICK